MSTNPEPEAEQGARRRFPAPVRMELILEAAKSVFAKRGSRANAGEVAAAAIIQALEIGSPCAEYAPRGPGAPGACEDLGLSPRRGPAFACERASRARTASLDGPVFEGLREPLRRLFGGRGPEPGPRLHVPARRVVHEPARLDCRVGDVARERPEQAADEHSEPAREEAAAAMGPDVVGRALGGAGRNAMPARPQ